MRLLKALLLLLAFGAYVPAGSAESVLPAEQSFTVRAERGVSGLALHWTIAKGTYLYRDHIAVRTSNGRDVRFSTPTGTVKDDPNFGPVEIFRQAVSATFADGEVSSEPALIVTFQGCTDAGLCYPPVHRKIDLQTLAVAAYDPLLAKTAVPEGFAAKANPDDGSALLAGAPLAWTALAFLGFGLLLSLTPCVYPMVPILAGIIAGPGGQTAGWRRGLLLSAAYVLSMATAYAVLGAAAAWSGVNLQAVLQAPWAIGIMAAILVALALGMFGVFELAVPRFGRGNAAAMSTKGSALRAAGLGFGAALVVGPCVTPPLAAALIYIAQSGDLTKGAVALFALGLGMGAPLILFGVFGAQLLPRSGPWLLKVRQLFGFVMVGAAIVLVSRIVPGQVALLLWAALMLAFGMYIGAFDPLQQHDGLPRRSIKAAGLLAIIYGGALTLGASAGGDDPLRPLAQFAGGVRQQSSEVPLDLAATVSSPEALDAAIGSKPGKPILIKFTADWCTICKDIERDVLTNPAVRASLRDFTVIAADVTHDSDGSRDLMRRLQVVGPPTLLVLDAGSRKEIPFARTTGSTTADELNARLTAALTPKS